MKDTYMTDSKVFCVMERMESSSNQDVARRHCLEEVGPRDTFGVVDGREGVRGENPFHRNLQWTEA
jgi:hypothetical protein